MDLVILPLLKAIHIILGLYSWVILVAVFLNWLILFQIVNSNQPFVRLVSSICFQLTDPPLAMIRRYLPFVNGIDLSPIILFFTIYFLQDFVERLALFFF